ncbi:hypothetical protein OUZ56_022387 [Daphnia magna]|uniref:Uncharacterized protein n=1 Tax=Daphnia magna TaxID=35525 RepID=A0ABR0AW77_9CRUS|nr:hypothetical protein OUZ56_022387 [Daphnia magna]
MFATFLTASPFCCVVRFLLDFPAASYIHLCFLFLQMYLPAKRLKGKGLAEHNLLADGKMMALDVGASLDVND